MLETFKPLVVLILLASFSLSVGGHPPSKSVLMAAADKYQGVAVGSHALNIPVEDILRDLDFFLRVFGSLCELVTGADVSEHTLERHRLAHFHLREVISIADSSRRDGKMRGMTSRSLLEKSLHLGQSIAARYFLNELLRSEDHEEIFAWLANILESVYESKSSAFITFTKKLDAFDADLRKYENSLNLFRQAVVALESGTQIEELESVIVVKDATKLISGPRERIFELRSSLAQIQHSLLQQRSLLTTQIDSHNSNHHFHLALSRFIAEIANEYTITRFACAGFNKAVFPNLRMPEAQSVLDERIPYLKPVPCSIQSPLMPEDDSRGTISLRAPRQHQPRDAGLMQIVARFMGGK